MTLESDAKLVVWKIIGICQIFTRALESLKIGTLMGFFGPKLKMHELKIYWGVMCHENEEWCKNWRGIDFSVQNWHEQFDKFWFKHSKISKICTLMGCLWPKYIMFDLKKYRGVMFDGTEHWCKIWRKTDLSFLKWREEFVKFLQKSRNWDFHGIVLSKIRKCISLKFTGELFVMTMKKDAKLEEELTCPFKIDMRTLLSFDPSTQNSPNFALY